MIPPPTSSVLLLLLLPVDLLLTVMRLPTVLMAMDHEKEVDVADIVSFTFDMVLSRCYCVGV